HYDATERLRQAAAAGDANATEMLKVIERHRGADVGQIHERSFASSETEWKPFTGDVKTYGVHELARLVDDLKENFGIRGDVLREWYGYWEAQGHGSKLIEVLEPRLLSESCREDDL